jgi:Flp pilus assembly protein TadG
MRSATRFAKLESLLRRFACDRGGVSAVEFAIVLPFMLALYLGSAELGQTLQIQYKVTEAARTVTDLASQYINIDSGTMSNILGASSTVVAPYSSSNFVVTVSQVQVLANATTGTVSGWSCSLHGTARPNGSAVTLPTSLQKPSTTIYVIFGEVTYPYTPSLGYVITGTITMNQTSWFFPRLVSSITGPSSC